MDVVVVYVVYIMTSLGRQEKDLVCGIALIPCFEWRDVTYVCILTYIDKN